MPALSSFDYAIVRVVPNVERGEFLNAGVILFCRTRRFLGASIELDRQRLAAVGQTGNPSEVRADREDERLAGDTDRGHAGHGLGLLDRGLQFQ